MSKPCRIPLFALVGVLLIAQTALAQVARVIDSKGTSIVERAGAAPRILGANEKLDERDTISVARDSWAILEFQDQTRITLRPNTVFRIDAYSAGTPESALMGLVKGGFRAVTGLIARRNPSNVRIQTAVATIGIRGTEFDARLCEDDCAQEERLHPSPIRPQAVARVVEMQGVAAAARAGEPGRVLVPGAALYEGDGIATGPGGYAVLVFRDGSRITVTAGSLLTIRVFQFDDTRRTGYAVLNHVGGGAAVQTGAIAGQGPEFYRFISPMGEIRPRGTGFFSQARSAAQSAADSTQAAKNEAERRAAEEAAKAADEAARRAEAARAEAEKAAAAAAAEAARLAAEAERLAAEAAAAARKIVQDPTIVRAAPKPGAGLGAPTPASAIDLAALAAAEASRAAAAAAEKARVAAAAAAAEAERLAAAAAAEAERLAALVAAEARRQQEAVLLEKRRAEQAALADKLRAERETAAARQKAEQDAAAAMAEAKRLAAEARLRAEQDAAAAKLKMEQDAVAARNRAIAEASLARQRIQQEIEAKYVTEGSSPWSGQIVERDIGGSFMVIPEFFPGLHPVPEGTKLLSEIMESLVIDLGEYKILVRTEVVNHQDDFSFYPFNHDKPTRPVSLGNVRGSAISPSFIVYTEIAGPDGVEAITEYSVVVNTRIFTEAYTLAHGAVPNQGGHLANEFGIPLVTKSPPSPFPKLLSNTPTDLTIPSQLAVWDGEVEIVGAGTVKHGEKIVLGDFHLKRADPIDLFASAAPRSDLVKVDPGIFGGEPKAIDAGLYVWVRDGEVSLTKDDKTVDVAKGNAAVATREDVRLLDAVPSFMRFDPTPVPTTLGLGVQMPAAFTLPDGALQNMCVVR